MLITSSVSLLVILIINLIFGIKYGFGFRHYWFFETLHFLGGFFLAMFIYNFVYSGILIFVGIAIVSFFWETAEYLLEKNQKLSTEFKKIFNLGRNINIQPKWPDTVLDIILNFVGAAIFVYLVL